MTDTTESPEETIMSSISREERSLSDALIDELARQRIALDDFSPAIDTLALARAAIAALSPDERLIEALEGIVEETKYWEHPALRKANQIARKALSTTKADQ